MISTTDKCGCGRITATMALLVMLAGCGGPSARLTGRVVTPEGRETRSVRIELWDAVGDTLLTAVQPDPDGRFHFRLTAKTPVSLRVSTQAEGHLATVPIIGRSVEELVFDISALASRNAGGIRFGDPESRTARFAAAYDRRQRGPRGPDEQTGDPYDWKSEPDGDVRGALLLERLAAAGTESPFDPAVAAEVGRTLPPDWGMWSFFEAELTLMDRAVVGGREGGGPLERLEPYVDYLTNVLHRHPDRSVRAAAAFHAMQASYSAGLEIEGDAYLQLLLNGFSRTVWAERAKKTANPRAAVLPGRPLPDFALATLDRSGEPTGDTLTAAAMRGSVYLIDFWATWCVPCIAEMENLHDTHERYRNEGFEILSVNMGEDPEIVARFRSDRWPMPWTHARLEWADERVDRFEVPGLPRTILVDPEGVVLESRLGIMGSDLPLAVDRALSGADG